MKVKIVSDGNVGGTKIVNVNTGEVLSCVQSVEWKADCKEFLTECTIHMVNVPVEIVQDISDSDICITNALDLEDIWDGNEGDS